MSENRSCNLGCDTCETREAWGPKQIGGWKGFVKKLYGHHKPSGGALIIRIVLGVLFAAAGWEKVTHLSGTIGFFVQMGFTPFEAHMVTAIELLGGILLILGFLTKPDCVALATQMAVIVWGTPAHPSIIYFGHDYEFVLLAVLVALYIGGPGKYSLAQVWVNRKRR